MLTRRAKAYSMPMLICNRFSRTTGQNRKNSDFYGNTVLWCPRAQVFLNLENRDFDGWNLRSMLKIPYAACPCLSQLVSAQFALEMCLAARNHQKIHKTPILAFKVIQGHWIWWQLRASFLLVINSNLGPISHRYWNTATY